LNALELSRALFFIECFDFSKIMPKIVIFIVSDSKLVSAVKDA